MISIEFMLIFAVSLAMICTLALEMLEHGRAVRERIGEVGLAASAERSARLAESAYRSGIMVRGGQEFRIEETLLLDSEDRVIEVEGVFVYDDAEPV